MPGAEDQSAANDSSRDRLPEDGEGVAGPVWFGRLSQLDFDIGFYEQLLARNGNSVDVLRVLGELLSQKGLVSRALQLDERLVACLPSDFLARYNLACSLALAGRPAEAIDSLAEAIRLGYDDMAHMKVDPDLASLRGRPEFRALFGRG